MESSANFWKKRLLKWQRMEKIRESNLYEATAPTAYDRFYLQKTYIWSHPLWTVELQHYHHVHNYAGFLVCFEDNHGVILLYLLPPGPNTVEKNVRCCMVTWTCHVAGVYKIFLISSGRSSVRAFLCFSHHLTVGTDTAANLVVGLAYLLTPQ